METCLYEKRDNIFKETAMNVSDKFKKRGQGISLEFFPPKSSEGKDAFMKVVNELKTFDPL